MAGNLVPLDDRIVPPVAEASTDAETWVDPPPDAEYSIDAEIDEHLSLDEDKPWHVDGDAWKGGES